MELKLINAQEKSHLDLLKGRYSSFFYSPSWELERRKKILLSLDEELTRKHAELAYKRESWHTRLQKIEDRTDCLNDILPFVKVYSEESQRKREKTMCEIITEELKIGRQKRQGKRLKLERDYLLKLRKKLQQRLNNFKIYKDYLNEVCLASDGKFPTITNLLERFSFLLYVRQNHIILNQKLLIKIEEGKEELAQLIQESNKEYVDDQNDLIELKKRQIELEVELECLEDKFANLKRTASEHILNPTKLKQSIYNLYCQTCDKLGRSLELDSSDVSGQVRFIQVALKQVEEVRKDVRMVLAPSSLHGEVEQKIPKN